MTTPVNLREDTMRLLAVAALTIATFASTLLIAHSEPSFARGARGAPAVPGRVAP